MYAPLLSMIFCHLHVKTSLFHRRRVALLKKRNVPIRFYTLPKQMSSYCWDSFKRAEWINDSLDVQDCGEFDRWSRTFYPSSTIFVAWRLTHAIWRCLFMNYIWIYANKKQVCISKNVCFILYIWFLINQQYQVSPIKVGVNSYCLSLDRKTKQISVQPNIN